MQPGRPESHGRLDAKLTSETRRELTACELWVFIVLLQLDCLPQPSPEPKTRGYTGHS